MSKKEEYVTPDVEFVLVDSVICKGGVSTPPDPGTDPEPVDPGMPDF